MRNLLDKTYSENHNTHFMFNNFFFLPVNRAIYGIMWENIVDPGKPQVTKKCGACALACRITKATDTHFMIFNTFCFSTATMVTRTRLSILVRCLSCVFLPFLKVFCFVTILSSLHH